MTTTHHAAAADRLAHRARQTANGRTVLDSWRELTTRPGDTRPYLDVIGQPYRGWSDGQLAALSRVDQLIADGLVTTLRVPVDAAPGRDADRTRNAEKLATGLPPEFTAELVDGNGHFGDGVLTWRPDAAPWYDGTGREWEAPVSAWTSCAPLEIGHTAASRTWLHLLECGSVARWPYHSDDLWLLSFTDFDTWAAWRAGLLAVTA